MSQKRPGACTHEHMKSNAMKSLLKPQRPHLVAAILSLRTWYGCQHLDTLLFNHCVLAVCGTGNLTIDVQSNNEVKANCTVVHVQSAETASGSFEVDEDEQSGDQSWQLSCTCSSM